MATSVRKVLILGAAGRDFHNFNCLYRDNDLYRVVAFTATQIPDIAGRRYPAVLAGSLYPEGIPIVEESANDMFWGAKDQGNGTLKGANVLGKLLMELRSRYLADRASLMVVEPPGIANFQLMGQDIGTITAP